MKIKFRGKTLDIQNKATVTPSRHFECMWNGYTIKATKEIGNKLWWVGVYCPMGCAVVDGSGESTLAQTIQYAFDNISYDIEDKRQIVEEYNQWLDLVKEYK